MIALVQRVARAQVTVAGQAVGRIERGLLVFICAEPSDTEVQAERMVEKLLKLRIFSDAAGKMNLNVHDVGGGLLIVSQFTLAADTRSGNRPSFTGAAAPALAESLYERVLQLARAKHAIVEQGRFGADMQVELVNDGPVTLSLTMR